MDAIGTLRKGPCKVLGRKGLTDICFESTQVCKVQPQYSNITNIYHFLLKFYEIILVQGQTVNKGP